MNRIITKDNPNPQPEVQRVKYEQLLAVVLHKLAPQGMVVTTADLKDFVSGNMLLMHAVSPQGIDLKVVTKEEAEIIIKNGQQVGHG